MKMILDVGCGHIPRGDVNIDLFIKSTTHRGFLFEHKLDNRKIPNFICADMNFLPIRDNAFDVVISDNAIEHTKTAYKAFMEIIRVSNNIIDIKTPHKFVRAIIKGREWQKKHHFSHFTRTWFFNMAKRYNLEVIINEVSKYSFFPHIYIPILRLPVEIHFKAKKVD
jgi:ubiquinone/menaquinone biosynthesis C-methylase UbiE